MSNIKDGFGKDYDDYIKIEWDNGKKILDKKGHNAYINLLSPKVIRVTKTGIDNWPAMQVTVDKIEKVVFDSYCSCHVDSTSKITPAPGVNSFCFTIAPKISYGSYFMKSIHKLLKIICCNADPGVTVTIGEP